MKTTIALLLFLFLSSITYRVRPKDCECAVKSEFYYKGKKVYQKISPEGTGTWLSQKIITIDMPDKTFTYDSVIFTPTN